MVMVNTKVSAPGWACSLSPRRYAATNRNRMVELSSRLWHELRHAYGPASNVPDLLRAARNVAAPSGANKEPWHSLWSALCHQYDVYSGSIAAFPHLVQIAAERRPMYRVDPLLLAAAIETYRHRPSGPAVPSYLEVSYRAALLNGAELTFETLSVCTDGGIYQGLLAALAAFQGQAQLAGALNALESRFVCPSCETNFTTPGYDVFES